MEEIKVAFGDQSFVQKIIRNKATPGFPVMAILTIKHHHRYDRHFTGLHEREDLKALIVRSEASRKKSEGIGFLCKI